MTKIRHTTPNCGDAVIYVRVSSADQVDGTSLDTQRDACRSCAARLGMRVLSEHEDAGRSAKSTVGRDALASAVAAARGSGATLIVFKFDRLARNLGDGYSLRDALVAKGCRIVSATEGEASATPISKAMYAMMMTFAELDNDMRAERSSAGMRARAMQGGWVFKAPTGFRIVRSSSGVPALEPDGDLSEVLRAAFTDFARGKIDKAGLYARLMDAGISDGAAGKIMRNPVYGGIIRNRLTGGEDVPAAFPGLVSMEDWHIIESRLRVTGRAHKVNNPSFPFIGAICGVCGGPLKASVAKGRYGYYFCPKRGHAKIRSDEFHDQVSAHLRILGETSGFLEMLKQAIADKPVTDPHAEERAHRQRSMGQLEGRLTRLRSALLDGIFDSQEYAEEKKRLTVELDEHRRWMADHAEVADRRAAYIDLLISVFSESDKLLKNRTVPEIKALVRIVFGKLTLTKDKKVEPSQDSLFTALATVQDEIKSNGAPTDGKIELLVQVLSDAACRLSLLLGAA